MEVTLSLNISKKNLNKALRVLSSGAKFHKKYAEVYSIAFRVDTIGKVSVLVPGGEYTIDAETTGTGCFALNYKWFKMLIKDCKMKSMELRLESDMMIVNNSISVKVKQSSGNVDLPLSLSYSVGELARLDLTKVDEGVVDFWGLTSQIEDAKSEIENVINKAYLQLAKYLPPNITSKEFKAKLRKEILIKTSEPMQ